MLAIGKQLGEIGDALATIGTLAQNFENTDAWKLSMAAQITRVRSAHEAILKLDVPPKISELRASVLNATTDCNAAMDKLASGIDKINAKDLVRATELMQSCGKKLQEAKPKLEALQTQP